MDTCPILVLDIDLREQLRVGYYTNLTTQMANTLFFLGL